MKRNLIHRVILAICLATWVPIMLAPESAWAAYKGGDATLLKGKRKQKLKETTAALRSLPRFTREAFFSEMLGLSFKIDGSQAIEASSQGHSSTKRGAHFVGSDGKERDWFSDFGAVDGDRWENVKALVNEVDVPVALSSFSRDITKLLNRTAKYLLDTMPPVLRDTWLAETGGLLFLRNGKSAYTGQKKIDRSEAGYDVPHPEVVKGALFIDSEGNERKLHQVLGEYWDQWGRRYNILHTCVFLTGKREILELCPKEMAAMSKFRKMQVLNDVSGAPAAEEPPSDMVGALKAWPKAAREAFIVERLGLCYMPNGDSGYDSRSWVCKGARYVGADGREYDFWTHSNLISDRMEWARVSKLYDQADGDVLENFKTEVDALKQAFNTHAPKKVRDRMNNTSAMGSKSLN